MMTFLQQMLDSQTVNRLLAPVALAWVPPWNWPWISKKLKYIGSIYIYAAFPYSIQTLVFGGSKAETSGFQHCLFPLQILFPLFHAFVSQHLPVVHWSIFRRSPFRNRAGLELGNGAEMMLHVFDTCTTSFDMRITAGNHFHQYHLSIFHLKNSGGVILMQSLECPNLRLIANAMEK